MSYKKYFFGALACLLIGTMMVLVGTVFKIQHWPLASKILSIGMIVEFLGMIIAIIALIKYVRFLRKSA